MYVEHVDIIEFLNIETFEEFSWSCSLLFFWLVLIDLEVHNCLYACIRDDNFFFLFVLSQSQIWLR